MENKQLLGAWGEVQAVDHLRKKGYAILACNYRCRLGEIDIIAKNRDFLVFVEVKLRKSAAYGEAKEFVDRRTASARPRSCGSVSTKQTCSRAST